MFEVVTNMEKNRSPLFSFLAFFFLFTVNGMRFDSMCCRCCWLLVQLNLPNESRKTVQKELADAYVVRACVCQKERRRRRRLTIFYFV